jgi:hypothetical protein
MDGVGAESKYRVKYWVWKMSPRHVRLGIRSAGHGGF